MLHSFDTAIAEKYGVHSAILLNNIYFWIEKNRANESNFHDGYYWTYNSKKAFEKLFPYMTSRQVDYALKKLIDDGILITGNYNKIPYDRTLWYAITNKGYSILQNCEMKETKLSNEGNEIVQPIPDNKPTDNKTSDCKPDNKKRAPAKTPPTYVDDKELNDAIISFVDYRKSIKSPMNDNAIRLLIRRLSRLSSSKTEQIEILNQSILNGWKGVFQLKVDYENNHPTQPQHEGRLDWIDSI